MGVPPAGCDIPCSGGGLEQILPSRFQPLKMLLGHAPLLPCRRVFQRPSRGPTQDIPDNKGPVDLTCLEQHSNPQWL